MRQLNHLQVKCATDSKNFYTSVLKLGTDKKILGLWRIEEFFNNPEPGRRRRLFTEWDTVTCFLRQTLSPDQSCRNAVIEARFRKKLEGTDLSSNTAAYCKARLRISEESLRKAAHHIGGQVHQGAASSWLWCGRKVKIIDGTTLSMPDTEENQNAYPQIPSQEKGLGFPIARILAMISLASGAIVSLGVGCYRTSEHTLLREVLSGVEQGDIILCDRHFDSYFSLALFLRNGADAVIRMKSTRSEFSSKKNGRIVLKRPSNIPKWMNQEQFRSFPKTLTLRVVWKNNLAVLTTLLDSTKYTDRKILSLYQSRWNVEVDLRSIKTVMQMDILRCRTPQMIRKEIYMHMLAYNLIRLHMSNIAKEHAFEPRDISFKATVQAFNATVSTSMFELITTKLLYKTIAQHRVRKRPGRKEPRAIKRRPKNHKLLVVPRRIAREKLNRIGLS